MPLASLLTVLGLLCFLTPVIMIIQDGGESEGDLYQWFARQPLHRIVIFQGLALFGFLLLAAGAMKGVEWTLQLH